MKKLLASVLLFMVPVAVLAAQPSEQVTKKVKKIKHATPSRVDAKTSANQLATGMMAAEVALAPAELAIAQRVHQGTLPCELGASVNLTADAKSPGYFDVQIKKQKYRMFPVATTTGAIRLEDQAAGAVWLQLANKSMLMNQKLGQRLADECKSPDQVVMAEELIKNPRPSVLDALPSDTSK
jgi:hypothetical protein